MELGICVLCTVEGNFNHDGLVAVERQQFLIICVGKEKEGFSVIDGSDDHGDT